MVQFTLEPLVQWARAAWTRRELTVNMAVAFDQAMRDDGRAHRDLLTGRGPGHAVVQALRRIDWRAYNAMIWISEEGARIDLREIGPKSLGVLIRSAIERKQWQLVARGERAGGAGDTWRVPFALMGMLHRNGPTRGPHERQKLRLAITGAFFWGPSGDGKRDGRTIRIAPPARGI
jgi:hypothetical protein